MSKTFRIISSLDREVVGEPFQIQEFSRTLANNSVLYPYQNEIGRYEDDTTFPVYRMESKAYLTDLVKNIPLSTSLMISSKCLAVFQTLKLPEYQIFPIEFMYKGSLNRNYFAFSIVKSPDFLNLISWEKSRFYKTSNYHRNRISEHCFSSIEQLLATKKELEEMGFGLMPEIRIIYNNNFDIVNFGWYPLNFGYLCSKHAKDQILDAQLTGFEFEEMPNDIFVRI